MLVAEDDFLVGDEIVRIIKNIGYEHIGTAPNGIKAVEMTKELKPDIILMDIMMPKMSGIEAALIIQEEVPTPIIILSANETQELIEEASNAGIGAYLTKPPQEDEVKRAVTIAFARQTDLINTRELNKRLRMREEKLQEINASKDKFFSIIAHDLRSPLSALIGYSDIIIDDYNEMNNDEKFELLKSVQQISNSMFGLLESLLEWSRYETGRMVYNPEVFLIMESLDAVLDLQKPSARKKEVNIEVEGNKSTSVYADVNMIETVFRNLISNAIKFTSRGGKIKIVVSKEVDGKIFLLISDNGVGMNEEQLSELFKLDKSTTTTGTEKEKGSGLGLVLCKELIKENGGILAVSSIVGKGSEFSFALPTDIIQE